KPAPVSRARVGGGSIKLIVETKSCFKLGKHFEFNSVSLSPLTTARLRNTHLQFMIKDQIFVVYHLHASTVESEVFVPCTLQETACAFSQPDDKQSSLN
ncbi:Cytochrome c oxidase subunit 1, partial [Frankliniella fusca]